MDALGQSCAIEKLEHRHRRVPADSGLLAEAADGQEFVRAFGRDLAGGGGKTVCDRRKQVVGGGGPMQPAEARELVKQFAQSVVGQFEIWTGI